MTMKIAMPYITQPNLVGRLVRETPATYVVEVVDLDFAPKTGRSGRCTHVFSQGEREWFGGQKGRVLKFWKRSGREIGGSTYLYA